MHFPNTNNGSARLQRKTMIFAYSLSHFTGSQNKESQEAIVLKEHETNRNKKFLQVAMKEISSMKRDKKSRTTDEKSEFASLFDNLSSEG